MLVTTDLITTDPLPQVNDYLIFPWLLPGRLTLMTGPTDIGKTTLTLELVAACLRGGHVWDRYPCKKIERILYLHGEHTLATLQEAAKARGDIPASCVEVIHDFGPLGSSLIENCKPNSPLIRDLKETILQLQPQLIIAEPISAFLGTSENDNREVRLVINILSALGDLCGAAVLTHHHVGKAHFDPERAKGGDIASGESRGAMAFEDAAERVIYLKRQKDEGATHIKLETPKAKGFPVSPVTLAFDEDTLTYSHVAKPFQERDLITLYNRRRKYPSETVRDMVSYFRSVWKGATNSKIILMLKRARRVGLLSLPEEEIESAREK